MIPKIVHQTAKNKSQTWEERHLTKKSKSNMLGWKFEFWDDTDNRNMISRSFPQYLELYDNISRGVMRADIARLVYMHIYGGIYIDTDYVLVKSFDENLFGESCIFAIEEGGLDVDEDGNVTNISPDFKLGNAFFASRKGHPFFADMIGEIFSNISSRDDSDLSLLEISGPLALSRFYINNYKLYKDVRIEPQTVYYPDLLANGLTFRRNSETRGAHLCWGSWRGNRKIVDVSNKVRRVVSAILTP